MDVAQDVVVTEDDCGTTMGITMTPHIEGGEIVDPLRERVLGRVVAEDVSLIQAVTILWCVKAPY